MLLGKLLGRPRERAQLRAVAALVLLFYLTATAFLGLFWVSRMELPVFDWHYLFGYCLLLAALWHLWLEWPALLRFFRSLAPKAWLKPDGRSFRAWVGWATGLAMAVMLGCGLFWVLGPQPAPEPQALWQERPAPGGDFATAMPERPTPSPAKIPAPAPVSAVQIPSKALGSTTMDSQKTFEYLVKESSASLRGLVRTHLVFGPQPRPTPWAAPVKPLPPPGLGAVGKGMPVWSSEVAATLLYLGTGVTEVRSTPGGKVFLRAAASAGALNPINAYLWADFEDSQKPSFWLYLPENHGLVPQASPQATVVAQAFGQEELSPPLVLLTGVLQRTVWKYGARSYRYVVLDAGHVATNLWLAAKAMGFSPTLGEFFADKDLAQALRLGWPEEVPLLGIALKAATLREKLPTFTAETTPANWERQELTRLSHLLTSWRWQGGASWSYRPKEAKPVNLSWPLATPEVFDLIRYRRSFRRFAATPLSAAQLQQLGEDLATFADAVPLDAGLLWHLLVFRAVGMEPGIYTWQGGWVPEKRGNFQKVVYRAGFSQELLARAGAVMVLSLHREVLAESLGVRGFRVGLLHGGMAGELLYLAAGRQGLGACGVGAFADEELQSLLGLGPGFWPVYLVAFGQKG